MSKALKSISTTLNKFFKKSIEEKNTSTITETITRDLVEVESVVDSKLTKIKGYLTNTPLNESSKVIRYNWENKYFTKQ